MPEALATQDAIAQSSRPGIQTKEPDQAGFAAPSGASVPLEGTLRSMVADMPRTERRRFFTETARETARLRSAEIFRNMLEASGMTVAEVARASGFDKAELSRLRNAQIDNGSHLFTLLALADAMEVDLTTSAKAR